MGEPGFPLDTPEPAEEMVAGNSRRAAENKAKKKADRQAAVRATKGVTRIARTSWGKDLLVPVMAARKEEQLRADGFGPAWGRAGLVRKALEGEGLRSKVRWNRIRYNARWRELSVLRSIGQGDSRKARLLELLCDEAHDAFAAAEASLLPAHVDRKRRAEFLRVVTPDKARGHAMMVLGDPVAFYFCNKCGAHSWADGHVQTLRYKCKGPSINAKTGLVQGNGERVKSFRRGRTYATDLHPAREFGTFRSMVHGDVENDVAMEPRLTSGGVGSEMDVILEFDRFGLPMAGLPSVATDSGGAVTAQLLSCPPE